LHRCSRLWESLRGRMCPTTTSHRPRPPVRPRSAARSHRRRGGFVRLGCSAPGWSLTVANLHQQGRQPGYPGARIEPRRPKHRSRRRRHRKVAVRPAATRRARRLSRSTLQLHGLGPERPLPERPAAAMPWFREGGPGDLPSRPMRCSSIPPAGRNRSMIAACQARATDIWSPIQGVPTSHCRRQPESCELCPLMC